MNLNYKCLFVFCFGLLLFISCTITDGLISNPSSKGNIYLVRHAERFNNMDSLSEIGVERSKRLAKILKKVEFAAIYSTDYQRTRETARPIADQNSMEVILYNPTDLKALSDKVLNNYPGENVLIVGHSNTTPDVINTFGIEPPLEHLKHDEYDNLFILRMKNKDTNKLEVIKF